MESFHMSQMRACYQSSDAVAHPISAAVQRAREEQEPIVVLGYGISNRPLVDILLKLQLSVLVYDQTPMEQLDGAADAVSKGAKFCHTHQAWLEKKPPLIFRSPGIRPDLPEIFQSVRQGAVLGSEMEWLLERTDATVLAITGSDGKSTTTTLTAQMLQKQCERQGFGKVFVGGNLGTPLLPLLPHMTNQDFVVVELSSFQLATPMRTPKRAAITNITPNHLNWHLNMEEYIAAKCHIFSCEQKTHLVTNSGNEITCRIAEQYRRQGGKVTLFSGDSSTFPSSAWQRVCCIDGVVTLIREDGTREPILPAKEILLPGKHNMENFMTACAMTDGYVSPDVMATVGRTFGGVEHRLEQVRTLRGITYYNSSIDSSPTRTAAALSALPPRSCVVICGGYDKHIPFAPLAQALCDQAGAVVLTGATRDKILAALQACDDYDPSVLTVEICPEFDTAVRCASALAEQGKGSCVLLSPACASFDAFVNFEARGRAFKQQVMAMT